MILYRHYIHVSHFFRFCEMFRPLYTCIAFNFARLHCVCFCPEPALVNVVSHKKLAPCKPCSYRFLVAAAVAVVVQLRLPAYEVRLRSGETGVRFNFLMRNDKFFRQAQDKYIPNTCGANPCLSVSQSWAVASAHTIWKPGRCVKRRFSPFSMHTGRFHPIKKRSFAKTGSGRNHFAKTGSEPLDGLSYR